MRVEHEHRFLFQVIQEVEQGLLVPAGMQRPYVWREADVLAFCESLTEGLPVGSLLTWKPKAGLDTGSLARPRLGPIHLTEIHPHARLILDGQNRLATLAWMLGGKTPADLSEAEVETWTGRALVIDNEVGGFTFVPEDEVEKGLRVSAAACSVRRLQPLLRAGYTRWLAECFSEAECDEFLNRVSDIIDVVREARVIETVISDAHPEEAKRAFLKICRTGVQISDADFDTAMAWLQPAA